MVESGAGYVKLANRQAVYLSSLSPHSHCVLNGGPALRGQTAAAIESGI